MTSNCFLSVLPNQPETPEVKALQDRLAATNLKMSDLRNQIQSAKQELRMAQKVFRVRVWDFLCGQGWSQENPDGPFFQSQGAHSCSCPVWGQSGWLFGGFPLPWGISQD